MLNRRKFLKLLGIGISALSLGGINLNNSIKENYSLTANSMTIFVDSNSPYSGTVYPIGTPSKPVNNMNDAIRILENRRFET